MNEGDFHFWNLLGSIHTQGNILYTPDGDSVISIVGNRVKVFNLKENTSYTLPFEAALNIVHITLSPDGRFLVTIDKQGHCLFTAFPSGTIVHRIKFGRHSKARCAAFSHDGRQLAVADGRFVQLWSIPRPGIDFVPGDAMPFKLELTLAGAADTVTQIAWSPDSRYLLTGARDCLVRVYMMEGRDPDFEAVTISGHSGDLLGIYPINQAVGVTPANPKWENYKRLAAAADFDFITVSKDGRAFLWRRGVKDGPSDAEIEAASNTDYAPRSSRMVRGVKTMGMGGWCWHCTEQRIFWRDSDSLGAAQAQEKAELARTGEENAHMDAVAASLFQETGRGKRFQNQNPTSSAFDPGSGVLTVGFEAGHFSLYRYAPPLTDEDAALTLTQNLSICNYPLSAMALCPRPGDLGAHVAVCSREGKLAVWDYSSEAYVLNITGSARPNAVGYSPNGEFLALGGVDGSVSVFDTSSGLLYATWREHQGPVTGLAFLTRSRGLVSSSADGSVKAYDLARKKVFRTMVPENGESRILKCIAVDPSGEIIAAGCGDGNFEVIVWDLKTGSILETLPGHEGPITSLCFSSQSAILASASWDRSVLIWDIFGGSETETGSISIERLNEGSEILDLVFSPSGKHLVLSLASGQLSTWDVENGKQVHITDIGRDIAGGRYLGDIRDRLTSAKGKCASRIAFSGDGRYLLAGGKSKWVCMYLAEDMRLVHKYQISHNTGISGVLDKLDSRKLLDSGITREEVGGDDDSDAEEERLKKQTARKDRESRKEIDAKTMLRKDIEIQTFAMAFARDNGQFAIATPEGCLIWNQRSNAFDPIDLEPSVTPERVAQLVAKGTPNGFALAIGMSIRISDDSLVQSALEKVPLDLVPAVISELHVAYVCRFVSWLARYVAVTTRLSFALTCARETLVQKGPLLQQTVRLARSDIRALNRAVAGRMAPLEPVCGSLDTLLAGVEAMGDHPGGRPEVHRLAITQAHENAAALAAARADEEEVEQEEQETLERHKRRRYGF
eukprot:gnl/Dysnectes_brevis/3558_a4521_694.p1 GENE.gnl/Dysnectes_brevis/3558_a4521_694~~gnl/Dysnectes_brevis/3558_a4521_694.p1  ORF type:complete len:1015 (+),score=364.49 gnl/Dysnectes_brevis/3558_a4521_694:37-3081(+)